MTTGERASTEANYFFYTHTCHFCASHPLRYSHQLCWLWIRSRGGNRTLTGITAHKILSLACLPISPPDHLRIRIPLCCKVPPFGLAFFCFFCKYSFLKGTTQFLLRIGGAVATAPHYPLFHKGAHPHFIFR